MTQRAWKDRWIIDAIARGYLRVYRDGSIWRCTRADDEGNLLSSEFRQVVVQVHKPTGRVYFNLQWRGVTKSVLVNRVVAWRYHPNPNNLPQVNHIDGDKEHNAADNLEWASSSENEKHAHRTGLKSGRGSSNANVKLTAAQVLEIRASADPAQDLAARYNVSRSTIANILSRRTWSHL